MAGSPLKRARIESGLMTPGEHLQNAKALVFGWLPECLGLTMELARGITVETQGIEGPKIYKRAPNVIALMYLIDRAMGKPATEPNEIDQRLNLARALFIEEQLKKQWIDAQVLDLRARGERAITENEMWEKQFVTEEQQEANLRAVVAAVTRNWLGMTPDEFAALAPGVADPSAALERLKGRIGRDYAEVMQDALTGGALHADEEEAAE